eukprot:TRINITY_DN25830_c0_g1_i4.p2 TRINITY_DN25830_c0_g1~~TRINITY_DN25830_c0_g1_i4.p2  ORF type:complete len:183 (-),score=42.76 TRINITY_DN25830_c0_g1_i4:181-729(-)
MQRGLVGSEMCIRDRYQRRVHGMRRYHIQDRDDYDKYNALCGRVTQVVEKLKLLKSDDPVRISSSEQLMHKLYEMGVVPTEKNLSLCERLAVSAFCRRRLPVVMVRLHMAQTLKEAVTYIEQGHVQVGIEAVTDPAFFVTRSMEDHIFWQKDSTIRQKKADHEGARDDYELLIDQRLSLIHI